MLRPKLLLVLPTLLTAALTLGASPGGAPGDPSGTIYRAWVEDVAPLLRPGERAAFEKLGSDALREAFIEGFWAVRDPTPGTARNELRERWRRGAPRLARLDAETRRRRAAQDRVSHLLDARPRLLHSIACRPLPPLEVWYFSRSWLPPLARGVGSSKPFFLLFAQDEGSGVFRQVSRHEIDGAWEGGPSLRERLDEVVRSKRCLEGVPGGRRAGGDLARAFDQALDWSDLVAAVGVPEPPERWFEKVRAAAGAGSVKPELLLSFPGRWGDRMVMRGLVRLPSPSPRDGAAAPRTGVVLTGEAVAGGDVLDTFHYTFNDLGQAFAGEPVLTFERTLTPGAYAFELRVEDLEGNLLGWTTRRLVVPDEPRGASPPPDDPSLREAADVLLAPNEPSLALAFSGSGLLVGELPVTAFYSGSGAPKVRVYLDGRLVGEDAEAPYELTVDLGKAPRRHRLRAVAVDAGGRELAEYRTSLNDGPLVFAVHLETPPPGGDAGRSYTARAELTLPSGVPLDRLELQVNGAPRATLYAPPFVQTLSLPDDPVVYVRAVAHLADGREAEDAVVVRGAPQRDRLDVQLVELYTTVLGRRGVPVTDLGRDAFTIYDEGQPQPIQEFRKLDEIPVHVCLALDASGSMETVMKTVRRSAETFLQTVLSPDDQAAVIAFDHRVRVVAPFTSDLEDLERSVESIDAGGGTALYDAVVLSLHYLGGIEGKRAVVLLSDGHDLHSHFDRDDVRELARRSGVAIYTIALGADRRLATLRRFARETGGRAFTIRHVEQLPEVYRVIERELRSQYLLTFQAPETGSGEYRRLKVKVARPGLEARTLQGYYRE